VELSLEKAFENYLEACKSSECCVWFIPPPILTLTPLLLLPGNPLALYNVATHYFTGQGVQQDLQKAREYYEKAAMLGFSPAQVCLLVSRV